MIDPSLASGKYGGTRLGRSGQASRLVPSAMRIPEWLREALEGLQLAVSG